MPRPLIPQETVHYKTHIKRALTEAMADVFKNHVDARLAKAKVSIDYPITKASYPAVVIRYFERNINNVGVGHVEWLQGVREEQPEAWTRMKHYMYTGDVEFAIYGLSSLDRDLLGDSVVQTITMGDLEGYTNRFFNRIYEPDRTLDPISDWHFININSDEVQGFGESQVIAPWMPEDVLVYQTSYRVNVMGEFYSLPPDEDYGMVEQVNEYPYIEEMEPLPEGSDDPAEWLTEVDDVDLP